MLLFPSGSCFTRIPVITENVCSTTFFSSNIGLPKLWSKWNLDDPMDGRNFICRPLYSLIHRKMSRDIDDT